MARRPRLLVVDDKPNFLALFRRIAEPELEVLTASDAGEALATLGREPVDIMVSDVKMPGMNGMDLLEHVKHRYPQIDVIMMTAFADVSDAVRAIKAGAFHYLTKPFDPDVALTVIREALARRNAGGRVPGGEQPLIASSPAMQATVDLVARAAAMDVPVLVTGESGTGKRLVVREIHVRGARGAGPFVALRCQGVDAEQLLDAMRRARTGTLCLEQIPELSIGTQTSLLAALQEHSAQLGTGRPVAVRVVAVAPMAALEQGMEDGTFRQDLFYRLNGLSIRVPALRERRVDIGPLADALLARVPLRAGMRLVLTREARQLLESYAWPGNVRQLENALSHAAALTVGGEIAAASLPDEIRTTTDPVAAPVDLATLPYREVLAHSRDRSSKEYLVALLKAVQGNVTQAAERAGLERESLHRLLKRYGLRAEDFRAK